MNGNPYHSPPSRHTRCLGDRFIESSTPERRPDLEEFPFLIAKAIAAGLVKRPDDESNQSVVNSKPIPDWRKISCIKCGEAFVRGHHHVQTCSMCRIEKRKCAFCEQSFQPVERKQRCCSDECSKQKMGLHRSASQVTPIHTCQSCGEPFPGRLSGAGWAKTCSDKCANAARSKHYAESRAARLAAKTSK